jgi:tetratricopeptide (TPR) repeat protein
LTAPIAPVDGGIRGRVITVKKAAKIAALLVGALAILGSGIFLTYYGYRALSVQMALRKADLFISTRTTARPFRGDPQVLARLAPHPLSSPLHNRRFDEAVAGARAAYEAADYDRAIALNTEALAIHPSEDLVWLLLTRRGNCHLAKREANEALADYGEAARLGGLDSYTYVNRATALRQTGKRDEAARDFEAAIAADPGNARIYAARAVALAEDGELKSALMDSAKAVELDQQNINLRLAYAELLIRQHRNQEAITQSTIALKIEPRAARAHVTRAKAYVQLEMYAEAQWDLDGATAQPADKAEALNSVAWCRATCSQEGLRDGKKAIAEATEACELDRWKKWGYVDTLAAACAEAGDFDRAAKYERQTLQMMRPSENKEREKQRLQMYEHHQPYRDS